MIAAAIGVYVVICGVGFFMGLNVEPYQMEYTDAVDSAAGETAEAAALSDRDRKAFEAVVNDIKENGKNALSAEDRPAAFWSEGRTAPPGCSGTCWQA